MFNGLDHIAIAVSDTQQALSVWRDKLGFPVLYSQVVNEGTVRLTHLDLGNAQLQLVEPLTREHPLRSWLEKHGDGLHHICMRIDDVAAAIPDLSALGLPSAGPPHEGTQGKRALFLNPAATGGVQVEITGR